MSVNELFLSAKVRVAYLDISSFQQTEMKPTACRNQNGELMFIVHGSWQRIGYFPKEVDQWLNRIFWGGCFFLYVRLGCSRCELVRY